MTPDEWIGRPTDFSTHLAARLEEDRMAGLERSCGLIPDGTLVFSSNDYLCLSMHFAVVRAAVTALENSGEFGTGAARLISGNRTEHDSLEAALADFKRCEAALLFPNGYAAACGTLPSLVGAGDTILLDRCAHACLFDGARLSGAHVRVFDHNDPSSLETALRWIREKDASSRVLVVVESVYSMEGDLAPLEEFAALKERYGAWLMVDEAHATGVFGNDGRGLCGGALEGRVEIQMGTLGKALGASGGFIAGTHDLIALLRNRARPFLFTTAMPACLAAAALKALELCRSKEGHDRRRLLAMRIQQFNNLLPDNVFSTGPITPVPVGDERRAVEFSIKLLDAGFHVPAIRYPTVSRGESILRVSLNSGHKEQDLQKLAAALKAIQA